MLKKTLPAIALATTATCLSSMASAYSLIYSPIVEYGETEIELYAQYIDDDDAAIDGEQQYVFEIAHGVTPRLFLEAKIEAEKKRGGSLETEAYVLEGVYQLTEQGEYSWDFGLLGEIEYSATNDELKEIEFGPIFATEVGSNMTFTANLPIEYKKQTREYEGSVNAQLKWRLSQRFEPALEVYVDSETTKVGPVVMGKIKTDSGKFGYQLGWLVGMNDETPDNTFKFLVEYEF